MKTHDRRTPEPEIDRIFRALANPTRRQVVERLGRGPASVSDLADPFDMALPSFVEHLTVLEEAGLVHSMKEGRVRTCRLAREGLEVAGGWLEEQRRLWEARLDRLDAYVTELSRKDSP